MSENKDPKTNPALEARRLSLHEALDHIHSGKFMRDCQQKHTELVETLMLRRGKGSLTISLKYGEVADNGLTITAEAVMKKPRETGKVQFLYADAKGQTYQDDPNEVELDLDSVVRFPSKPKSATRAAAAGGE